MAKDARTVVYLGRRNTDAASISLYSPADAPDARATVDLECVAESAPFSTVSAGTLTPDLVQQAGTQLYNNLLKQTAIAQRVKDALAAHKPRPFYLYIAADEADKLPWETLCAPGGFMALDQHWQIGRMAGDASMKKTTLPIFLPLRIMIFLTATAVDATAEWTTLYSVIESSGLSVELVVYVSQKSLLEEIRELVKTLEPADNKLISIQVKPLPYGFLLKDAVDKPELMPHIIHFFCHGSAEGGVHLNLATPDDWEVGASSIQVAPQDFDTLPKPRMNLMLVTLNCCESAAVAGATVGAPNDKMAMLDNSFIRQLVAKNYTPAAVGMREPVDALDAHTFSGAFYGAMLTMIKSLVVIPEKAAELEWASYMYEARRTLCDGHANGLATQKAASFNKEWTLPVLYSQSASYKIKLVPGAKKKIAFLIQLRKAHFDLAQDYALTGSEQARAALAEVNKEIKKHEKELLGGK